MEMKNLVVAEFVGRTDLTRINSFSEFLKKMVARLSVGQLRYGNSSPTQKYFSRLRIEANAYSETGNKEHLINIANYAYLEFYHPQHDKAHYNPKANSVTRNRKNGKPTN
jgi:hypothetical protein